MSEQLQWSLPADWYWREDIYQRELERIFRRQWQWVGLERALRAPGDHLRLTIAGHDLILVRTLDGVLRAWHNVCRHRGSKLVMQGGKCDAFACPYHGWRYSLDGALIATPRFGADILAREGLGLIEAARVETWRGLVFLNFDFEAAPLQQWLGVLGREAEAFGLDNLVHETDLVAEVACNWKTYVDNYNEAYHLPVVHPTLARDLLIDDYHVVNADGVSLHHAKAREGVDQPGIFGLRFPNFAFITYFNGVAFLRMEPMGPRSTRLTYSHFRPSTVSSEDFQSTVDYAWQVSKEDQQIVPHIQDNLERGVYEKGPLNPRHENGVIYFQQLVREALR